VKERDPFKEDAVGLLRLEEQTLLAATSVLQQRQERANRGGFPQLGS